MSNPCRGLPRSVPFLGVRSASLPVSAYAGSCAQAEIASSVCTRRQSGAGSCPSAVASSRAPTPSLGAGAE